MRTIPPSELIINDDGSIFHLHLHPGQVAPTVILVGDPGRVAMVAEFFDSRECEVTNREFHTVTGTYRGKRMTVLSTGIALIIFKQQKGLHSKKVDRGVYVYACSRRV